MGGGSNSSGSSSRPLNAAERAEAFQAGLANIASAAPSMFTKTVIPAVPGNTNASPWTPGGMRSVAGTPERTTYELNAPKYVAPEYTAADLSRMADGDYDRLEREMLMSRTAPLEAAYRKASSGVDDDAARRGVWSSGLAIQGQHDLVDRFAPELRAAAGEAATARYGAQMQDNTQANQSSQFNSAQRNSMEMENANREYNAAWGPVNYLKDIFNGTGGTVSSGSGGGWNFSI